MADSAWPAPALVTLHDTARFLALAERDELAALPDGGLPRASWRLLCSYVPADPLMHRARGESDIPVLSWLYRTLGMGGLIGVVNGRLRLARAAHDWLALPASAQVPALRQIWYNAPEVAWAWLPPSPGSPARTSAWHELTHQLVTSVIALPIDTWVLAAEVLADLAAQAEILRFGVARNLPSVHQALVRQADLLAAFLLTEALPRLGILTLHGEATDRCLAVTTEGADWLRRARRSGQPAASPLSEADPPAGAEPAASEPACWQVDADLRLTVPLEAPAAATFDALLFADLLSAAPLAQYRITRASLERCVSHGVDPADVPFLLAHGAGQPLPGPAVAQLTRWQDDLTIIYCEPGYRLRPATPALMTTLRGREPFRAATELAASRRWAFVGQAEAATLMRYLRRSGYVLSPGGQSPIGADAPPALAPLLRRRLPLVPLATLAGFYGRLRARVPGLADLGLANLEQTLLAALAPAERAAVARLITSDDALLADSLHPIPAALDEAEAFETTRTVAGNEPPPAADPSGLPGLHAILTEAIAHEATLDLLYADTQGAVTQRRVRPLRLEERWGRQYLVAYCELRGDERSFRLDRIVEVTRL